MKIWSPQPKQAEFMSRPEYEVLFGGSAGGGKSEAVVIEALRQVHIPHYRCLVLRKTYPQLTELIEKTLKYYPAVFPSAVYNSTAHTWTFPSGAKIVFGSLPNNQSKYAYQGKAFDLIIFDELTHFTFDEYMYLMSRNRPNGGGTRVYMRATANPGNIGHGWVKERFISPAPPMTPIEETVEWETLDGKKESKTITRCFVPSSVWDNEALIKNDPLYVAHLASLPEAEKKALLYGDWDSFSGQAFFLKDIPAHYEDRVGTHVINDFIIPDHWKIVAGFDYGYTKPFALGYFAVDKENRIYHIKEVYGCTGTPDVGIQKTPQEIARLIKEIEATDINLKGKKIYRIADPAIWQHTTGESIEDMMEREGVFFNKGDHSRLAGKAQFDYRLMFDDRKVPMFYVFKSCRNFIRTIPNLVYDEKNVEDIDTTQEDHIYDMTKYVFMEHPINPTYSTTSLPPREDPLNLYKDNNAWKTQL